MNIFTVILVLAVISFGVITPSINAEDVIRYNMTLGFNNQLNSSTNYTCDAGYHLCSDSIGRCCMNGYFCCTDSGGGCCPDGTSCESGHKCSKNYGGTGGTGGTGGLSDPVTIIIMVVLAIKILLIIFCRKRLFKWLLTTRENRRPQTA
nr:1128_t:CDS:1 [Entrophospora candida]